MADEPTFKDFLGPDTLHPLDELAAIEDAVVRARAFRQGSAADMAISIEHSRYTLQEIPGIGRYARLTEPGWNPLLTLIHDAAAGIDFSFTRFPKFDAVVSEYADHPQINDSADETYKTYKNLHDNIAAVRNFLLQLYFGNPPEGMSAEKAETALQQIAAYVGEGIKNNLRFLESAATHDPRKPFIVLADASEPDGRGAQYIYEKILEMQRHDTWLRPFDAVLALFGGKIHGEWMLPPAETTPFRQALFSVLAPPMFSNPPTTEELEAQQRYLEKLEARRQELMEAAHLNTMAQDMNAIGNHLLYTSDNLSGIAHMAEPVRREAIEIAKEILRKLKLVIGDKNILDGLKLKPQDDMAGLGAITCVALVYARLVAWACGIDPSIMQHPSVMAATRAIGQLGYIKKLEAHRLARLAGNRALAEKLKAQLAKIPPYFSEVSDTKINGLLEKIERGIDTVMNRVHEVSGPNAMIGHKAAKDISSFMHQAPTAGQAMQLSSDATSSRAQKQAAMIEAQDMAERAQAQRIQAQAAQRAQQAGQQAPAPQPATRSTGRQAMQQARQQAAKQTSTSAPAAPMTNPGLNAAQRAAAQRNAFMASQAREHEEREHHHPNPKDVMAKIDPRVINNIRAATNTAGITNAPVTTNRAQYDAQKRAAAKAQAEQQAKDQKAKQATTEAAKKPPQPPKGRGM